MRERAIAMDSEVDRASAQPQPQPQPHVQVENTFLSESQGLEIKPINQIGQVHFQNLKQLKSFVILRSALTTFTGNFKFMLLTILSVVPLFAFMIFYEIKLQTTLQGIPIVLDGPSQIIYLENLYVVPQDDIVDLRSKFFSTLVQLSLFYLVLHPMLEMFSIVITIKFAAKIQSGDTQVALKEALYKNNFKGLSVTYLCVHLLSILTLLGLFWVVLNHNLFSARIWHHFELHSIEFYMNLLSIGFHSAIFIALLYVYLGWSAFWNMSIVISVMEEETGIWAFGLSDYYGKHCKSTGFQLMLVFFAFGNVLRVPSLFFGLCNSSSAGVSVTAIVIGLVCLGNLVKWVAFVLYFYDCKQQVMEKKGDEEVGKSVKKDVGDAC